MICPKCGKEIPDDSLFCGECGAEVQAAPEPIVNEMPQEPVQDMPKAEEVKEPEVKSSGDNNTMSIISLILAIVGFIFTVAIFSLGLPAAFLGGVLGIVSIILGVLGRKSGGRSIGTAGMIVGIIDVAILAVILVIAIIAVIIVGIGVAAAL